MAARSPSPNPCRPSAHNPRAPESSLSIRKSKEIPQRSSLSKPSSQSLRSSFEQKENVKSRSPAVSKGSKNFMAPTVSAASKVVPPSPRKRILQERNEVINLVSSWFELPMPEVCNVDETEKIRPISELSSGSQEILSSCDAKKGEPRIKNHRNVVVPPFSPLSAISPLDADPSRPPYDPKTNYLSPRPQFLHYRPNPCIEQYHVGDGKQLEDSFHWDSSEDDDTVLIAEKDSEEEAFPIMVEEVEVVESPSKTHVSEPEFKSKPLNHHPFSRPNIAAFFFVMIVAFLYVPLSDSPIIASSVLKDPPLTKPFSLGVFEDLQFRDYFAVANEHFHGLASMFRDWSHASISHFTYLTSPLSDDLWVQHLVNMTSLTVDEAAGLDLSYELETENKQAMHAAAVAETKEQVVKTNGVQAPSFAVHEMEVETKQVNEDNGVEELTFAVHQSGVSEAAKEVDAEGGAGEMEVESLDENTEMMEDGKIGDEKTEMVVFDDAISENMIDGDHVAYELEKQVIEGESSKELEQEAGRQISEAVCVEEEVKIAEMEYAQTPYDVEDCSDVASFDHTESEFHAEQKISHGHGERKSTNFGTMLGLSFAPLALSATLVFLYKKQKRGLMIGPVSNSNQPCAPPNKGTCHQNLQEDGGTIGASDSSEESCIWNNTSSSGQSKTMRYKDEQDLSDNRRLRRESAAYSSTSYGSFTTYERLSGAKKGGDEEVVTPVRRSSRIRSIVTSP